MAKRNGHGRHPVIKSRLIEGKAKGFGCSTSEPNWCRRESKKMTTNYPKTSKRNPKHSVEGRGTWQRRGDDMNTQEKTITYASGYHQLKGARETDSLLSGEKKDGIGRIPSNKSTTGERRPTIEYVS